MTLPKTKIFKSTLWICSFKWDFLTFVAPIMYTFNIHSRRTKLRLSSHMCVTYVRNSSQVVTFKSIISKATLLFDTIGWKPFLKSHLYRSENPKSWLRNTWMFRYESQTFAIFDTVYSRPKSFYGSTFWFWEYKMVLWNVLMCGEIVWSY